MFEFETKIRIQESIEIVAFYFKVLLLNPLASLWLIMLGVLVRVLSIAVFVLIVKVFLSIIDPVSSMKMLNQFSPKYGFQKLDESQLSVILVSALAFLVLLQLVSHKILLSLFLRSRQRTVKHLLNIPLSVHEETNLHVCIDKVPLGYDGIVKSAEILVFYVFLFLGIFFINPLAGVLVLFAVPIIIALMLLKGRKEVFVQKQMLKHRKSLSLDDDDAVDEMVSLVNVNYSFGRNTIIYSDFFGGVAIIAMMLVFIFLYGDSSDLGGLTALILVFSIRFSIVYAGELSRCLGRVLQQRVLVDKIEF